ncbi:MAG: tRNA pseudouridine(38-40) synthase TruA [Candidatus Kapaibacterium sp.]
MSLQIDLQTVVLVIQYDGTAYSGWQIQKNADTIQNQIQNAIQIVCGNNYNIIAAGRTDAGVHAQMQVASFQITDDFRLPEEKIKYALNSKLPHDIRIIKAFIHKGDFHARFDAVSREYRYYLSKKYDVFHRRYVSFIKYPFDTELLIRSAEIFMRKDNFTTFSKFNPDNHNPICNVDQCKWEHIEPDVLVLTVRADHFLYGMVRSLVGTMIDIARGKRSREEVDSAFRKHDRNLNSPLAPPQGLFLNRVDYDKIKL